jgi:hypothetical protein
VIHCLFSNGYCVVVFFILQLVMSVDESLYQKSLQATILKTEHEWAVDDDEALVFYPKVRLQILYSRLFASDLAAIFLSRSFDNLLFL